MQFDLENPFESQFEKKTLSIFQEKYENPFEETLFSPVESKQQFQQQQPLQASQLCYKKQFEQDYCQSNPQTCFNFNFDNIESFDNHQVPNYVDVGEDKSQLNQFEDDHLDQIFEQQSMQSEIAIDFKNSNKTHTVTYQQQQILAEEEIQKQEEEDSYSQLQPAKSQDFENPEKAFSMEFMPFDQNTEANEEIEQQQQQNNNFKFEEEDESETKQQQYKQQIQFFDNDETNSNNNNNKQENNEEEFQFEHADKFKPTKIWKVTTSIQKKKKQRDYDKNIVRYLARQIIRCCVDKYQYQEKVKQFCEEYLVNNQENHEELQDFDVEKMYESTVSFLLGKIEFITGHRAFQNLLCFDENPEAYHQKCVFRNFACWFLKERALRYIISGSMTDKKSYLKFKNSILLYYVRRPEKWNSNTKFTQKRK